MRCILRLLSPLLFYQAGFCTLPISMNKQPYRNQGTQNRLRERLETVRGKYRTDKSIGNRLKTDHTGSSDGFKLTFSSLIITVHSYYRFIKIIVRGEQHSIMTNRSEMS